MLDALDLRIVRTMGVQPYFDLPRDVDHLRPARLARKLGLRQELVKARVQRMEKEGFLAGYEIYPNLRLLGLDLRSFLFRCSDARTKASALDDLRSMDGIGTIENHLGTDVSVEIFYRNPAELDRRVQLLGRLLGNAQALAYLQVPFPPAERVLTNLDWRIIRALRGNALRPLRDVARELKLSWRTVRRHFDAMWAHGLVDTVAWIDPGRVPGLLFCNLHLRFGPTVQRQAAEKVFESFEDSWCYCWAPPDKSVANLIMGMVANSLADVEDLVRRAQGLPGVDHAEALLTSRWIPNRAWLDEAIQDRIERTTRRLRAAA